MFHTLLDPHSLAKVLNGMAIHSVQRLEPVSVTLARHPVLGVCTIVQDRSAIDAVLMSEHCALAILRLGEREIA